MSEGRGREEGRGSGFLGLRGGKGQVPRYDVLGRGR